jgi:epoxyqueuosine reductase
MRADDLRANRTEHSGVKEAPMRERSAREIADEIKRFMASPANAMTKWDEPAWAEPLVGFSNGADPLYGFYKEHIGDFHETPVAFLSHKYPEKEFDPERVTVVSWILPQTEATKRDHRAERFFPSERWARTRIFGEEANVALRRHMETFFADQDIAAVAPQISPLWAPKLSERYGYASKWSERHAAYAAGLGTFGLSDALITPAGKAHRAGSIVIDLYVEPSKRPYENHTAYCLFHSKGTCGKCMERCPIGAITEQGHDKNLCKKYVDMTFQYVPRQFHFDGYGCGLCQTGIPCESSIPEALRPKGSPSAPPR